MEEDKNQNSSLNPSPSSLGPAPWPNLPEEKTEERKPEEELKELHKKIYAEPGKEKPEISSVKPSLSEQKSLNKNPEKQLSHHHLKIWVIVFSALLILLLSILGISLYKGDIYWVRDMFGFGLPNDSVKAVEKVTQNMSKAGTYKGDFNFDMQIEADKEKTSIVMAGSGDFNDSKKEAKLDISLKDIKLPDAQKALVTDLKSKPKFSLITFEKEVYFKADSSGDKWQKIALSTLNFSDLSKYVKTAKKLKDEKIRGENSYHYALELDAVKAFENNETFKAMPDFQKEVYKNLVSKYMTLKMDFWVSKKSLLLNKQTADFDMKFNMADFGSTGIFKLKFLASEDIKDAGKSVKIEKPGNTTDFDINSLMKIFGGSTEAIPGTEGILKIAKMKERDAQRKADLKQIKAALAQYYEDSKGEYPASNDDSKDGVFLPVLKEKNYMAKVPIDPLSPTYYYNYVVSGKSYVLTCVLENKNDAEGVKSGELNIYTLTNK